MRVDQSIAQLLKLSAKTLSQERENERKRDSERQRKRERQKETETDRRRDGRDRDTDRGRAIDHKTLLQPRALASLILTLIQDRTTLGVGGQQNIVIPSPEVFHPVQDVRRNVSAQQQPVPLQQPQHLSTAVLTLHGLQTSLDTRPESGYYPTICRLAWTQVDNGYPSLQTSLDSGRNAVTLVV